MAKMASVIVNNLSKHTDKEFDYIIPSDYEDILKAGMRVIVPFGKGNKSLEGYVVRVYETEEIPDNYKYISDLADFGSAVLFSREMINLAYFLKERYHSTLSEAFRTIMPSGTSLKENIYIRTIRKDKEIDITKEKYIRVLENLQSDKFMELKTLNKALEFNISRAELFDMESLGLIELKIEMEQNINIKTAYVYAPYDIEKCNEFIKEHPGNVKKQALVLEEIIRSGLKLTQRELCSRFDCSNGVIKALEDKGLLMKIKQEIYRNPFSAEYSYGKLKLTEDQENAVENIINYYNQGKNMTLIYGVTGCGKTEIYLNLIEKFISKGYGAIMLVPEISLTPQTVERFKGRFGDVVAVLHSRLSEGEKYDEWRRINNGNVKVVVGARSAVFAPVQDLKIIIIDEEHEYSYKSELTPKYITSEVAQHRIRMNNGLLIMGSATPSIESYYKAEKGIYNLIEIDKRVMDISLPGVKIIDMREELKNGNRLMFSMELFEAIKENLENKNQTILFLNRRGYSTFISCRSCGYSCKCDACDVSLTYHIGSNKLSCHYCGKEAYAPKVCPKCGSKYIKHFGAGTEKIEEEIKKAFPMAKILRMDMDTTRKKGEHERLYNEFKDNKADILIGTQMISKGMDFKNVTLVGVIAADTSLNLPDFRAAERTFQLLTQVSGRAGRGERSGRVIVQTYDPEHYSIMLASKHDYKGFYSKEIEIRKMLNNPPFSEIFYVLLTSEYEEEIIKCSNLLKNKFKQFENKKDIEIFGPTPCHISKIKNIYRWHMIFKGNVKNYYNDIHGIVENQVNNFEVNFSEDINPYNMI